MYMMTSNHNTSSPVTYCQYFIAVLSIYLSHSSFKNLQLYKQHTNYFFLIFYFLSMFFFSLSLSWNKMQLIPALSLSPTNITKHSHLKFLCDYNNYKVSSSLSFPILFLVKRIHTSTIAHQLYLSPNISIRGFNQMLQWLFSSPTLYNINPSSCYTINNITTRLKQHVDKIRNIPIVYIIEYRHSWNIYFHNKSFIYWKNNWIFLFFAITIWKTSL
jgi:hypothetical protein